MDKKSSSGQKCFQGMGIRALKSVAMKNGVDIRGCVEKADIIEVLRAAAVDEYTKRIQNDLKVDASKMISEDQALAGLTISQLKRLADDRHVDISSCLEKHDIIKKLQSSETMSTENLPSGGKTSDRTHERTSATHQQEYSKKSCIAGKRCGGVSFAPGTAWANCRSKRKAPPPGGGKTPLPFFAGATG